LLLLFSSCSNETINNLNLENQNLKKEIVECEEEIKDLEAEIKSLELEIEESKASEDKMYNELQEQKEALSALQALANKRPGNPKVIQPTTIPTGEVSKTLEQWAVLLDKKKTDEIRDLLGTPRGTSDSGYQWYYREKVLETDSGVIKDLHVYFLPRESFGKNEKAVTFVGAGIGGKISYIDPVLGTVKYAFASDMTFMRSRVETWVLIKMGKYRK
jgi:hypothetical protein